MAEEINLDNAAEIIMQKVVEIVSEAVAGIEPEHQTTAAGIIGKDLWDRLTAFLNITADELREKAGEMDEDDA